MQLLQCSASLPSGSRQCNSCNALPHCLGAAGNATRAMHCLTAWGQQAVDFLQCTASLPLGSGQWNSCNATLVLVLTRVLYVCSMPLAYSGEAWSFSGDLAPV